VLKSGVLFGDSDNLLASLEESYDALNAYADFDVNYGIFRLVLDFGQPASI
jgi:hypothetical protein